jgi:PEP-CTERM motif
MRRFLLFLAVLLVVASTATGVHASTDCERWFIAYKNSLAQTNAARHLAAAKRKARHYVHRKLAALHKPAPANKPKVLPARFQRPKMTREEALRRFNLACGDMPEESAVPPIAVAEDPKPSFFAPAEMPLEDVPPAGLVAENAPPPGGGTDGGYPFAPGFGGGFGGGGTAPGAPIPHTPGTPGTPGTTSNPPPPSPPISPVPEPGSLVLMLTGIAGAAGVVRRRFAR